MLLKENFDKITKELSPKENKDIHYKSVFNFIQHLDEFSSQAEKSFIEIKLTEYLELVKSGKDEIDKDFSMLLFQSYILTLGEKYHKIGFTRIIPLRYLFLYGIMADSLLYLGFFRYPYPITCVCITIHYFLVRKRKYDRNLVYGMFY